MADSKLTALTETTAPVATDIVYVVTTPGGTPASKKATLTTLRQILMVDGWIEAGETWTYASADAPTFTFTISGDKTGKYSVGMRVKLTQTTIKYFIITAVSYGAPNTTVTIYGGTDYTLANAAITLPFYSMSKAPLGFPLDPLKWTVITSSTSRQTQATPTQNTWYNVGSLSITIPIGAWSVVYQAPVDLYKAAAGNLAVWVTLSTTNNGDTDADFRTVIYRSAQSETEIPVTRGKYLTLAAKTAYYLNIRTTMVNVDSIGLNGDDSTILIYATCAYL